MSRGHYEVHGEVTQDEAPSTSSVLSQPCPVPTRFSFQRQPTAIVGSATVAKMATVKTFQRNIYIADFVEGKLETSRTLTVRFSEFEATVAGILNKVSDALDSADLMVLTDGQGNKIMDSEGTRGSAFWKQSARKVVAVKEVDFSRLQCSKRRRLSRKEDTGLSSVLSDIEEIILAAEALPGITAILKDLANMAQQSGESLVILSNRTITANQAATIKSTFSCLICKARHLALSSGKGSVPKEDAHVSEDPNSCSYIVASAVSEGSNSSEMLF
ncbi:hypothetical protein WMY93_009127 [Mugilogobius chulae]|uniref:Uncharacterized protein n=1 Tax=Mugilogobius chulae TaxID=88201 RepID=A0AAW0PEI5_9GOBI